VLVTEVDGRAVSDPDTFLEVVGAIEDREIVPIRVRIPRTGAERACTLRTDLVHFPTREFVEGEQGWVEVPR